MGQVVEPLVFGRGTGVTPIAVIASTVFWTWLWGPLGLLLAMPMTVCLAVLGRHVEGLEFLDVLLGDEPALTPAQSFYQRALTGDAAEATYQAEFCLKDQSLETYLDQVALTGLKLAERDYERGAIDGDQEVKIANTVKEMMDNLADFEPRRWFAKLRPAPEKNGKEKNAKTRRKRAELPRSPPQRTARTSTASCPWSSAMSLRRVGWSTRRSSRSAVATRSMPPPPTCWRACLRKRGLGVKEYGPEVSLGGAYQYAHRDRGEASLPVLSRPRQWPRADPLSGAALAAYLAPRSVDHGLLLGRGGRPALGQIGVGEHRGRRLRHLFARGRAALHEGRQRRAEEQTCRDGGACRPDAAAAASPAASAPVAAAKPAPDATPPAPDKPKREPKRKSQSAVA